MMLMMMLMMMKFSWFFFPLATSMSRESLAHFISSHAKSMSPASCRSKRVDDHSRFYANFRDFCGARVSTLLLKPNADPVVLLSLSSAAHEAQRVQCSALFVVVAEQEILLNHDH